MSQFDKAYRKELRRKLRRWEKLKHEVRPSMLERIWQYIIAPWRKRK